MYIAACDDNALFLNELREQLRGLNIADRLAFYSDMDAFFSSVENGEAYDAVLMDIDWGRYETGIDAAEKLYELSPRTRIIYVTGYNDRFSQRIFLQRSNLSGYLVKPVDSGLLRANLEKVQRAGAERESPLLTVVFRGRPVSIPCREIFYLESHGHTVTIHTRTEKTVVYDRLEHILKMLPDGFIQCHKSFAVNMRQIRRFQPPNVLLQNDAAVPVSRSRYPQTKAAYFRYIGKTF